MAADKQIIINTINWILNESSAAVFAIDEHYVQAAVTLPVDIGLESAFINMGFHLEEGGNYSRRYYTADAAVVEKLADDIVKIFEELYRSDPAKPFEVTEL